MNPIYQNLPALKDETSFILNNQTYRFAPEKWYGKKVFFFVQKNGTLGVKELNLFERALRYLRIAYRNTHLKNLKKALNGQNWTLQSTKENPIIKQILEKLIEKKMDHLEDVQFSHSFEEHILLMSSTELVNKDNLTRLDRYIKINHATRDETTDFLIKASLVLAIYQLAPQHKVPKENNQIVNRLFDQYIEHNSTLPDLLKQSHSKAVDDFKENWVSKLMEEPLRKLFAALCQKLSLNHNYSKNIPDEKLQKWLRIHFAVIAGIACPD